MHMTEAIAHMKTNLSMNEDEGWYVITLNVMRLPHLVIQFYWEKNFSPSSHGKLVKPICFVSR